MKILLTLLFALSIGISVTAQKGDFPFGKITLNELEMVSYPSDTSAAAVILREFGQARINHEYKVVFDHHVVIKILKESGKSAADFKIALAINGNVVDEEDRYTFVQASTFNKESNRIVETKLNEKSILVEPFNKYRKYVKFPLPNVRVGSVVEVKYTLESPYLYRFKQWNFQNDYPTDYSEFWAEIPANFNYNINLRGFYKLSSHKLERKPRCFQMPGTNSSGYDSDMSDCSVSKYVMEKLPAFEWQEYLTSDKNYRSALYFELSEYIDMDGRRKRFSETWKDINDNLKDHEFFGVKIRKGKKFMEGIVPAIVGVESNELAKAQVIFDHIKSRFLWNGDEDLYTRQDVKKSFEDQKGSSADINFSLIAALQAAGLNAEPVLVSTRDNGIPNKLNAQRIDFNYVIAHLKVGEKSYLLDATDPVLSFGMLPLRCLNDQGRLLGAESSWIDLKTPMKQKTSVKMDLSLTEEGHLNGKLNIQYFDYNAVDYIKLMEGRTEDKHVKECEQSWKKIAVKSFSVSNKTDITKPVVETFDIDVDALGSSGSLAYFNPFFINNFGANPLKLPTRLFPVDFGTPVEISYFVSLNIPEKFKVEELPPNAVFALPNNGGKCLLNITRNGNRITLSSIISFSKPIYQPEEYIPLKEFFSKIIDMQNSVIVFNKL